jgi:NADH:ubiquinone oxidoreductase subunit 2 (subunit N)
MPGYVMVALAAASSIGVSAAMFYLVSYALMNIGAFAVIVAIYMREPDVATMQLEAPPFSLRLAMWVNAAALR